MFVREQHCKPGCKVDLSLISYLFINQSAGVCCGLIQGFELYSILSCSFFYVEHMIYSLSYALQNAEYIVVSAVDLCRVNC